MKHHRAIGLIKEALSRDLLFAVFFLPDEDSPRMVIQGNSRIKLLDLNSIVPDQGFIFAPFLKEHPIVFIDGPILADFQEIPVALTQKIEYDLKFKTNTNAEMGRDAYLEALRNIISGMNKSNCKKVVFSRYANQDCGDLDLAGVFMKLKELNPGAFVSIVNLPGGLTWIGASPEILLRDHNNICKTIALAATRSNEDINKAWSNKELKEHQYVVDYIMEILKQQEIISRKSEVTTQILDSGLTHLCREFQFEVRNKDAFWKLAFALHPTPALCGIPKEVAMNIINQYEIHDREYYGGFLGPVGINGYASLFVNIRTALFHSGRAKLFAGGGITDDSNPDSEWAETELKMETIRSALNSQRKLQIFSQ